MATWRADLLSDTLTTPSAAMRAAMAAAPVGDDVFAEDPTVLALQEQVAGLLGKEDALFTPSGSMANQLAVRLHAGVGQEILGDSLAHVLRAEMGMAATAGITSRTWVADHGRLVAADAIALMVPSGGDYQVSTACVLVENTHNFGGGTIQDLGEMRALADHARRHGVAVHLDGARLWNAHVATGVPLADYAACADTVTVCLSKGLGAPVGSLLAGTTEAMGRARIWRKRLGGGMRQVGILAAAGQYALAHNVERLADDHARAHRFAAAAAEAAPGCIDPDQVRTNIVVLDLAGTGWDGPGLVTACAGQGIRAYAVSPSTVRFVWHLDVDDAGTDAAIDVVTGVLRSAP